MTTTNLSKQDYLKKYLSDGDKKKKKKKKVTQNSVIKSKIIDDDIDLKNMKAVDSDELEVYDLAEEAPQIVGIIDERPEEVRLMSEYRGTKKWKIVADEFGIDEVKVTAIGESQAPRLENAGDSDASPPRKTKNDAPSPARKIKKEKSDSDASPPRKGSKKQDDDDSDASPPRRTKPASPPMRKIKKEKVDSDESPPRRSRKRHDSDASPPRRVKRSKSDSDASPPRRIKKEKSDSDASPPRKSSRKRHDSDSPRRKRRDSDSPSSRRRRRESDSPHSRNQKRHKDSNRPNKRRSKSPESHRKRKSSSSPKRDGGKSQDEAKSKVTLGGKKSGLQNAQELRKEIEELKEREKEMKANSKGQTEAVVVRDRKTGKRIDPKEEARKRREKEEKEAEKVAQYAVWGKGVKQVQDSQDKLRDDLYEMSKPLARYADDKDLDEMLKSREWDGDPMLEYMRKKKREKDGAGVKPKYEGAYMPNRYGIRPGHRWDGVDRSNGYEKKWFEEQSAKKAREEEAFKWSTADM